MGKLSSKQLEHHQTESLEFLHKFNNLPSLKNSLYSIDYQYEMITVMHYLLGEGLAKPTGNYDKTHREIPLFNHNNNTESIVKSITRAPGIKLLQKHPVLLEKQENIEKLMLWIVSKYKEVKKLANETYVEQLENTDIQVLNTEQHLIHIIAGAAHTICKPCKKQDFQEINGIDEDSEKTDFLSRMTRNEKLLFISSLFILSTAMIVFYYSYPKVIHFTLISSLVLFSLMSATSLIIIKTKFKLINLNRQKVKSKPTPKRLAFGISTILLSLTLTGYQLFLLSMLTPNDRNEVPYVIFIATLLTFMIFILCGYLSIYQITYALTKMERNKNAHFYFRLLSKYKKNILPIIDIIPLLFFSSITLIALANFQSLWSTFMDFGAR